MEGGSRVGIDLSALRFVSGQFGAQEEEKEGPSLTAIE